MGCRNTHQPAFSAWLSRPHLQQPRTRAHFDITSTRGGEKSPYNIIKESFFPLVAIGGAIDKLTDLLEKQNDMETTTVSSHMTPVQTVFGKATQGFWKLVRLLPLPFCFVKLPIL